MIDIYTVGFPVIERPSLELCVSVVLEWYEQTKQVLENHK